MMRFFKTNKTKPTSFDAVSELAWLVSVWAHLALLISTESAVVVTLAISCLLCDL